MKILRIAAASTALAAGAIVGGLATSASPASADVPATVQYITTYVWVNGTVLTTGTATCPSGTRMVSSGAGGLDIEGITPNTDYTGANAMGRSYTGGGYMQVTVGCAPAAQISEVTTRTAYLSSGAGYRTGRVDCPAGMKAFGGGGYIAQRNFGFVSQDAYYMAADTVAADGNGWIFTAYTTSALDRVIVTTQCAPLRSSYVALGGVRTTADYTLSSAYAGCLAGYTALSGGVYLVKADGTESRSGTIVWSVPASGNRWYANGVSWDGSPPQTNQLVVAAVCIR